MGFGRKKQDDLPPRRRRSEQSDDLKEQEEVGAHLFTRNRTLVGSISSRVKSATELNASLQSPRVHGHHLAAHRRRLGLWFVGFVFASMVLIWFLYDFTAGIMISSSVTLPAEKKQTYVDAISDYLNARPVERLRTLANQDSLTEYLQRVVPEVESVKKIDSGGLASSRYVLVFREPVASWLIDSDLYYVDKNGIPFRANYYDAPGVKILDRSGVPQVAGTVLASSSFLRFVGLAVETSRVYGLEVKQAIIPADTTRQIELKIAGHRYAIKLSLDRPVGEQVEDMARSVTYLKKKRIAPVRYLDVRVSGRAYYR